MTKPKHTPGPWPCVRLSMNGEAYATHYEAHIDCGACMVWAPPGNEEQEANARLIAAAPELLEALRELHDFADQCSHYQHRERSAEAFRNAAALLNKLGG